jgi:hypothetical protein
MQMLVADAAGGYILATAIIRVAPEKLSAEFEVKSV